jgi:hypothetical protein
MSWVPSFLKRKTHKYETQADLDKLTADEIIHLDPKEVGFYVEKNEGGVKLTGPKRTSMLRLLSIKRDEKDNPSLIRLRASVVDKLTNQDKEVEKLMRDTQAKIDREAAEQNTMRNRLALLSMPKAPTTRPTISRKGGRKSINTRRRRATRAKLAIKRSYKRSHKRTQRTRRR